MADFLYPPCRLAARALLSLLPCPSGLGCSPYYFITPQVRGAVRPEAPVLATPQVSAKQGALAPMMCTSMEHSFFIGLFNPRDLFSPRDSDRLYYCALVSSHSCSK